MRLPWRAKPEPAPEPEPEGPQPAVELKARRCSCSAVYVLAVGATRETCSRCAGLVCPRCSAPTVGGGVCHREGCRRALARSEELAYREDRRRGKVVEEELAATVEFPRRATG